MGRRRSQRLALAFFESVPAADAAASRLQRRVPGRTGTAVGVLDRGCGGELVVRLAPCAIPDPHGPDGVLLAIARALAGSVPPPPGPLLGSGSDLSLDDLARVAAELEAGQAMVAVLDRRRVVERAVVALTSWGGRAEVHRVSDRALPGAAPETSATTWW